ncbi:MAG: DUF4870 domain-containing protein [Firmicutes bacterium]|nr:DUF4870 domain-containing protein [Bacillota bacterium]
MKSIFGLDQNLVAALSYIFGPFSGIAVLIMERGNKFVRFHAMQSTLWFTLIMIVTWVLRLIRSLPLIGWILGLLVSPAIAIISLLSFVSLVFLVYKAYQGEDFKLPIIGDVVWTQVNK